MVRGVIFDHHFWCSKHQVCLQHLHCPQSSRSPSRHWNRHSQYPWGPFFCTIVGICLGTARHHRQVVVYKHEFHSLVEAILKTVCPALQLLLVFMLLTASVRRSVHLPMTTMPIACFLVSIVASFLSFFVRSDRPILRPKLLSWPFRSYWPSLRASLSNMLTMVLTAYNCGKLFVLIRPLLPVFFDVYCFLLTYHSAHNCFELSDYSNRCEHQVPPDILRQHRDHQNQLYWWSVALMKYFHLVSFF